MEEISEEATGITQERGFTAFSKRNETSSRPFARPPVAQCWSLLYPLFATRAHRNHHAKGELRRRSSTNAHAFSSTHRTYMETQPGTHILAGLADYTWRPSNGIRYKTPSTALKYEAGVAFAARLYATA
ncbi:hypothetical protein BHE74_00000689 [Ensete ventricosum]|nr:hypothetical protein BHE74_00000689 [Ensete ventricosum]